MARPSVGRWVEARSSSGVDGPGAQGKDAAGEGHGGMELGHIRCRRSARSRSGEAVRSPE